MGVSRNHSIPRQTRRWGISLYCFAQNMQTSQNLRKKGSFCLLYTEGTLVQGAEGVEGDEGDAGEPYVNSATCVFHDLKQSLKQNRVCGMPKGLCNQNWIRLCWRSASIPSTHKAHMHMCAHTLNLSVSNAHNHIYLHQICVRNPFKNVSLKYICS